LNILKMSCNRTWWSFLSCSWGLWISHSWSYTRWALSKGYSDTFPWKSWKRDYYRRVKGEVGKIWWNPGKL